LQLKSDSQPTSSLKPWMILLNSEVRLTLHNPILALRAYDNLDSYLLSPSSKAIFRVLISCFNSTTGQCNPSNKFIKSATKFSLSTIGRQIKYLKYLFKYLVGVKYDKTKSHRQWNLDLEEIFSILFHTSTGISRKKALEYLIRAFPKQRISKKLIDENYVKDNHKDLIDRWGAHKYKMSRGVSTCKESLQNNEYEGGTHAEKLIENNTLDHEEGGTHKNSMSRGGTHGEYLKNNSIRIINTKYSKNFDLDTCSLRSLSDFNSLPLVKSEFFFKSIISSQLLFNLTVDEIKKEVLDNGKEFFNKKQDEVLVSDKPLLFLNNLEDDIISEPNINTKSEPPEAEMARAIVAKLGMMVQELEGTSPFGRSEENMEEKKVEGLGFEEFMKKLNRIDNYKKGRGYVDCPEFNDLEEEFDKSERKFLGIIEEEEEDLDAWKKDPEYIKWNEEPYVYEEEELSDEVWEWLDTKPKEEREKLLRDDRPLLWSIMKLEKGEELFPVDWSPRDIFKPNKENAEKIARQTKIRDENMAKLREEIWGGKTEEQKYTEKKARIEEYNNLVCEAPDLEVVLKRANCEDLDELRAKMLLNYDFNPFDEESFESINTECYVEYCDLSEESRDQRFIEEMNKYMVPVPRWFSNRERKMLSEAREMADSAGAKYLHWVAAIYDRVGYDKISYSNLKSKNSEKYYREWLEEGSFLPNSIPITNLVKRKRKNDAKLEKYSGSKSDVFDKFEEQRNKLKEELDKNPLL
jgi:hypothetical protein